MTKTLAENGMNRLRMGYKYWQLGLYPGSMDDATEKQISYALQLLDGSIKYHLDDFEFAIEKPMEEMNKGDLSFIISCLLGKVRSMQSCKCGKYSTGYISIKYWGDDDLLESKEINAYMCDECMIDFFV